MKTSDVSDFVTLPKYLKIGYLIENKGVKKRNKNAEGRSRTEQVFQDKKTGDWIAGVCYKNTNGKRTPIRRKVENKTRVKQSLAVKS